ncbi:MAG: (d)CMP kinase [Thermodesulfobacteriota bacterium]|nr:(d)CMP kinase [Thermodesulfobacteriota bacterium]
MKRKLIIAIDGPSGSGKSTVSRILAKKLDYTYLDTGAMYRAVALSAAEKNVDIDDEKSLRKLCSEIDISVDTKNGSFLISLDGKDVTEAIRSPNISLLASSISAKKIIRDTMLRLQRKIGERGGIVMEGRDIGTVVFPNADIKFYLYASAEERGKRRYTELKAKGEKVTLKHITSEIVKRDRNDSSREYAPLKPAKDAIHIDSTNNTVEEVVERLSEIIKRVGRM